jgi:hypothetical protein
MADDVLTILSRITTVSDMTQAFSDEDQCRRLLEAMVWPRGRICPACGYKRSTTIPGRDWGKTSARPVPMFKQRLPPSVYSDDEDATAFDQIAVAAVASGLVANPAIGQGAFLGAVG